MELILLLKKNINRAGELTHGSFTVTDLYLAIRLKMYECNFYKLID